MLFPIKVLDVEISQPVCNISGLEGYSEALFLVRLYGQPIGHVTMPVINSSVDAALLMEKIINKHNKIIIRTHVYNVLTGPALPKAFQADQLLDQKPTKKVLNLPQVTVVVCSRNRTADLTLCLNALMNVQYSNLEIVVVDNAPSDKSTEELVKRNYPSVRYVCEPRPGLDWARNRGIMEAKGEIVAYTDDDVIVDEAWVSGFATLFEENKEVMAATGLVVPFEMETEAQVLFEKYGGFGRGFYRKWIRIVNQKPHWGYLGTGQFGTGANMAFRKSIFEKIGFFDPALDVGTVTNGGGDLEMYFRVIREGYTLVYEPNALVRHRHRREYSKLKEQLVNNGKGLFSYFKRSVYAYPELRFSFLRLTYWWIVYWICKKILKTFIRPSFFPRDLILAELKGSFNSFGLYKKSRKKAMQIAAQFGNEADVNIDKPKGKRSIFKTHAVAKVPVTSRKINIRQSLQPIEDIEAYAIVQISIYNDKDLIGKLEITNNFQNLDISCIADAIADTFSNELFQLFNSANKSLDSLLTEKYSISHPY